ncbi:MAG: glycerophosphodiester phosphodiesterase family protein [Kiritimatiellae bacterium]|nr:glycerophosphodiester phosphodiesterase family protein [Kiritimatiellia bacterium]
MRNGLMGLVCVFAMMACGAERTDFLHLSHVHRGGGKLERPDNTLETFLWCWGNGSALECDCRCTADGVGIMFHDNDLNRTPRGIPDTWKKRKISEMKWEEIRDIDVGSYLSPEYASQRIPTIEAVMAAMKGRPTYLLFVDEKGAGPDRIAAEAKKFNVQDQVYYTGPSYGNSVRWTEVVPNGKTLLWVGAWPKNHSPEEMKRTEAHFEKIFNEVRAGGWKGVTAVSLHTYYNTQYDDPFVPSTAYLKKLIDECHAHGVKVCSIPFEGGETEEVYHKLWELGCDAFSTDYPSVMFKVIRDLKAKAGK